MSISGIKTAIQTAVEAALGIKCYTDLPGNISEIPCAYIMPRNGDFNINIPKNKASIKFDVILLVGRGQELGDAQKELDVYLLPTGTTSMKAALETTSLLTNGDFLDVAGWSEYGATTINESVYASCKWQIQVMV